MTSPSTGDSPTANPGEPRGAGRPARQRWRLVLALPAAAAPGEHPAGVRGWAAIVAATSLPLAGEAGGRGRVVPAAALPLGIAGEHEIVDVYLAERWPVAAVRDAVAAALPTDWGLVGLHDVWVGAPAAPAAVVAADYRVEVAGMPLAAIEAAIAALLRAVALLRERRREKQMVEYDLRPLLLDLSARAGEDSMVTLLMRLRHGPDSVGRPEEVIAALLEPPAPPLPTRLEVRAIARSRLVLVDDADAPAPAVAPRPDPVAPPGPAPAPKRAQAPGPAPAPGSHGR